MVTGNQLIVNKIGKIALFQSPSNGIVKVLCGLDAAAYKYLIDMLTVG
jgi:hypothetical protein